MKEGIKQLSPEFLIKSGNYFFKEKCLIIWNALKQKNKKEQKAVESKYFHIMADHRQKAGI